jgi:hypothetical protein
VLIHGLLQVGEWEILGPVNRLAEQPVGGSPSRLSGDGRMQAIQKPFERTFPMNKLLAALVAATFATAGFAASHAAKKEEAKPAAAAASAAAPAMKKDDKMMKKEEAKPAAKAEEKKDMMKKEEPKK